MKNKWKTIIRRALKATLWFIGIWLALLVLLEAVLSQSVLTGIVNKYAGMYVDGDLRFGKVSASMFRHFPNVALTLEDFSITYPSDRFDEAESKGVQGHLMHSGCGEDCDTLASFRKFSVAMNVPSLLNGTINLPYIRLEKPRIFAHSYHDGSANWNIFASSDTEEVEDTTESETSGLPGIILGRIRLSGSPHIVYTDSRDTIFALVNMKRAGFTGKINTRKTSRSKVGLTLDSMFVAGRIGRDTLSLGLERLYIHENGDLVDIDAAAKAFMATRTFGRMMVPVDVKGSLSFPRDTVPAVKTENFNVNFAYIPIMAEADLRFHEKSTYVKAKVDIDNCKVDALLDKYADNFMPDLKKFSTDAKISLLLLCEGEYDHTTGRLPQILANVNIPASGISHESFPGQELRLALDIDGEIDAKGEVDVSVNRIDASAKGLDFMAEASIGDLLGKDPELEVDAGLFADLDTLSTFIPDSLNMTVTGALEAHVMGKALLSQLDMYNFSKSSLTGELLGESIRLMMPDDTVSATLDAMKITLGPEEKKSRKSQETVRLMGITGEIGSADIAFKDMLKVNTSQFRIAAKNVIDTKASSDTTRTIHPFGGSVSAQRLMAKDNSGSVIRLDSTWNGFQILPKKGQSSVPVLTLNSRNGKLFLKYGVNRAIIADADISARAAMNTFERRAKMKEYRDSLAGIYPDIPKDSLFRHHMAQRGPRQQKVPEWMQDEDFRQKDIDISLDKTLAKYFRNWDLNGSLTVGRGKVMTPYFPLKNELEGFDLKFTNDKIAIRKFDIASGNSDISLKGELTGLKRALLGRRGSLKLDADISSTRMNANELLAAYSAGISFDPDTYKGKDTASEEEYFEETALDTVVISEQTPLIVIPANFNADINLNASNIRYSSLQIDKVTADLTMKERCVQITDTKASSNMGEISLEGFYATRSKKDLKAGFSINFKDITSEKVISLMPAIDTIMPLVKSFGGLLNCEIAATSELDTNMNIIMPSIDGVVRISGDDLTIKDSDMFKSMAKLLLFKNKKEGRIDHMMVEGVINDNKLEVFPFILEMDRYMLGLSGIQNMDMSFRYHASLIKSPFLIKVGVDLYGPDFDNMKFKIGKAKYKSKDIPVFSTVIDATKVNLVKSIRNIFDKGIDATIKDNARHDFINEHKKKIGYVQAVDQQMEELSGEEQKKLEEQKQLEEQESNNITNE